MLLFIHENHAVCVATSNRACRHECCRLFMKIVLFVLLPSTGPVDLNVAVYYRAVCVATYNLCKTTLLIFCGNYIFYHILCYRTLHQQHMFSLFQITIHSHKQLPPIHSQPFLHFCPSLIVPEPPPQPPPPHPHLKVLCVVFICLLVETPDYDSVGVEQT